jgi:hypothetical protein
MLWLESFVTSKCNLNEFDNKPLRRGLVVSSTPASEETEDMGREIESRI